MSALAEAIRRKAPKADLGQQSAFAGLRRRSAGTVDVVAQSVAATAPAGVLLIQPGALWARNESLAYLNLAVTIALVLGVGLAIGMFARRVSSAGSVYTFVVRGLGPHTGVVAGAAILLGYLAIAVNTLSSGAERVASLIMAGDAPPTLLAPAIMVVFAVVIVIVIARGLRISTRVLLVLETVAVAVVLALSITALTLTEWDASVLLPRPQHVSPEAIMTGVAFAMIAFVGFESGAALGPETRRPFAAVPRAILLSAGATGLVMLVGTAAQLSLVVDGEAAASLGGVTRLTWLIDLIVAVSFLACALAMTNAATRIAFALSREGIFPGLFGRTSGRGVPLRGAAVLTTVAAGIPIAVMSLGGDRDDLRTFTSPASILGFVLAYALVCLGAPAFLRKIGELTVGAAVVALLPFAGLLLVLAYYVGSTVTTNPIGLWSVLGFLAVVVVAATVRMARRPRLAERIGMHDWPVATDCIEGSAGFRP